VAVTPSHKGATEEHAMPDDMGTTGVSEEVSDDK
jgi:hypothetical protein